MVLTTNALVSVLLLLSALGLLFEPSGGLMVLACTWGIVYPAIGFVLTFVVIARTRDDAT